MLALGAEYIDNKPQSDLSHRRCIQVPLETWESVNYGSFSMFLEKWLQKIKNN